MQSYTGDVAILVFRGTEPMNIVHWLTDLTVSTDRFLEGDVHGGILRNLKAIWPLVSMGLHTVDSRKSLMLLPLKQRPESTDTVGSSDSRNPDPLHKEVGDLVFRHVYAYDVVPQLPPLTTGRFKHFGHEYRCTNRGEGWMLNEKPALQTRYATWLPLAGLSLVAEQFPVLREWLKDLPLSVDHHSPRYYMRVSELSRTATF